MSNEEEMIELPPIAVEGIHAGFPSPAQDYMNACIDLNKELVHHPAATFYGRVVGDSMLDAGVQEGDILVIDKALEPMEGDMAVCFVDGEFALKFISFKDPATGRPSPKTLGPQSRYSNIWLLPANKAYKPIKVTEADDFTVWGIVTYVIKKVK
jgi:DNA polymerase V